MKKIAYFFLGVSLVAILFFLLPGTSNATAYVDGTLLKSPKHASIYYVENNKRRAFVNSQVYYTWFSNFDSVQTVTVDQMESIELGNPMPIKANTKLLKFPLNPRVYSVVEGDVIRHIPDEYTANSLFGNGWAKDIIELPEIYYLFYTKGDALEVEVYIGPESLSPEDLVDTGDCPDGMLFYKNTIKGFEFCYDEDGEVKLGNYDNIIFSRLKGGEAGDYDGSVSIQSGFTSLTDYTAQLDGNVETDIWGYNANDVAYRAYNHSAGGWSGYEVIFQNQVSKDIVVLSYMSADSDDRFFMDGPRNTFQFLSANANGLDPWEANTTLGVCPEYPNTMDLFKREYQSDSYSFCYGSGWTATVGTGDKVDVMPNKKSGFTLDTGMFTISGTQGLSEYENIISDSSGDVTNLTTFVTADGASGIQYDHTDPSLVWYHSISLFDGDSRRADLTFSGDINDYKSEFTAMREEIVNTFKFLDY